MTLPTPLADCRILLTRSLTQSATTVQLLEELGATPIVLPMIEIQELPDYTEVNQALNHLQNYNWLILTSSNGAHYFLKRLEALKLTLPPSLKIATVGSSTAQILAEQGIAVDLIPPQAKAESLAQELLKQGIAQQKILALRANIARQEIIETLRLAQAIVDDLPIYQTIKPNKGDYLEALEQIKSRQIDYITFTSSSTVNHFYELMKAENLNQYLKQVYLAAIGPVTAKTLQILYQRADIIADEHSIEGLVQAIVEHRRIQAG